MLQCVTPSRCRSGGRRGCRRSSCRGSGRGGRPARPAPRAPPRARSAPGRARPRSGRSSGRTISPSSPERHAQDAGAAQPGDLLETLVAGRPGVRDEAGDDDDLRLDVTPCPRAVAHLPLERADLVEDVDDLAAGVGQAEHVRLAEPAVGREDEERRDHGIARGTPRAGRGGRLEEVDQEAHRLGGAFRRLAPARGEAPPRQRSATRPTASRARASRGFQRFAEGGAELGDVGERPMQEKRAPVEGVEAQELVEPLTRSLRSREEAAGEVPVQEGGPWPIERASVSCGKPPRRGEVELERLGFRRPGRRARP